ncbi:hypothetical protein BD324DRAFT_489113 [Kockovaella imperatae]|uniref:Sugar phosphate transporter domain-containing protein n=1 Tax=Kockovaella imperatae TaxID=4999 RepID=A0A1Y1UGX8_9TREE|nr:hypothetical protein BD324DRAFT_489113 [Kockovaella imperatae]ORX36335.1 hypothetical protein BD324DRAFT_489113 [Kockovaella imperatae]
MAQSEQHSRLAVLGTVVFYMVVAISMTLLNKNVLSSTPLPVFLLFCQSAMAVFLLALENRLGPIKTPATFEMPIAKELAPLVGINVLGLIFNNYCLQYVDASFHQVARGLVLPCTILITIFVLKQYPSRLSLIAALIVTSGFFSGVLFDPNHASSKASAAVAKPHSSVLGILFGASSSIASACHAILIKKSLTAVQGSAIALSYYNNILSTLALIPLVIICGEGPGALRLLSGEHDAKTFFWGAGITGVFGFLISLASFISIKVTSPVTHMISSAARGVLQTMLAVYFFGDIISSGRMVSIALIITGSVLYVYSKSLPESDSKAPYSPLDSKSVNGTPTLFDAEEGKSTKDHNHSS